MLTSLPPLFADKRIRIILGTGCILLAALNGFFYYRDLALAAQSKSDIRELNQRSVAQRTTPAPSPSVDTTPTPVIEPSPAPATPVPKPSAALAAKVTPPPVAGQSSTGKVKITTATEAQFDTLPGIGPSKAKAIVEYRASKPFTKLEELKDVPGIGDKTYENLLPFIEL